MLKKIIDKVLEGKRLTFDEAYKLYLKGSFFELGDLANLIRKKKHPENIVTYVVDRNINYSNICVCGCKFCAFFKSPGEDGGYVLSFDELDTKIQETLELGGTQILLQGGHHPDLKLDFYENMLTHIKEKFPTIHIHGFSPPEIVHFSKLNNLSIKEVIKRLIAAGLDSIPGGGAEILVDRVRHKVSPNKCSATEWLDVMETAHKLGLKTTATMMFGHVETMEDRILHLIRLRDLQDKTRGFTAFIPWGFQPDNTRINARKVTSVEYLRLLAISRIVLDNFDNIQVSWVTMGPEIAQLALFFGGNDFGSTMIEENVVAATGVRFRLSIEEIEKYISEAGFEPRQRRMDYTLVT
ncbi:cyclic dehypoxanthinyl futalosine synthase [Desulfothermus naphthae]